MDRSLYGPLNQFELNDGSISMLSDQKLVNRIKLERMSAGEKFLSIPPLAPEPVFQSSTSYSSVTQEGDLLEDDDFSDVVLKYINQMLMEEDMEDKACMFQESSAALQAAERSFYELLGECYPPPPNSDLKPYSVQNQEGFYENGQPNCLKCTESFGATSSSLADPGWSFDLCEHKSSNYSLQSTSHSSHSSLNSSGSVDAFADSPVSTLKIPEIFSDSESVMQFRKGFEEASKFLPSESGLSIDLQRQGLFLTDIKEESKDEHLSLDKDKYSPDRLRGKKNPHPEDTGLENGRSNKQSAVSTESSVSKEMFDMVLLSCQSQSELREALRQEKNKNAHQNGQSKGSNGGKTRGKKHGGKMDVVDLRTLLTLCAQAVAADDRRSANDLLKQIRQHTSPTGDGMQRMAHYFAQGLEARLAGSGTQIYTACISKPTSAADILKAYHLFLAVCPFRKLSNFFSNRTIINLAERSARLHIIDFGILYGFQWPCLIRRLTSISGGPPKLRITGIDLPQPGFRPAQRVEETGRRLANYAETFKVPFEFNAIAQKWDTIQIEDLKIEEGEVLVVNCMYRLRNLLDETVVVDSPRNKVLNLIRKINPKVFIVGIVNGAYSAPFFITRFREALFHFSTLYDMLETNVPRESPERTLIEKDIFGWEAMNVIACEGGERIERPETYKQWQLRNMRAGFRQLPLNTEIKKMANEKVKTLYHKDFVIDEDGRWLLQGWKGRIVYALSSWVPAY